MEVTKVTFEKTYIVTHRLLLSIGVRPCNQYHPKGWKNYCIQNIAAFMSFNILFYTTIAEGIYLYNSMVENFSLLDVTAQLPCVLFCAIGCYKLFVLFQRRNLLAELVQKLKDIWPNTVENKGQKDIVESYISLCIIITTVFAVINVVMVMAFNFLPIPEMFYNRFFYNLDNRQVPYNIWFPFDSFSGNIYYFIYVFHVIAGYIVVIGNMGFDCLYCIPIAHLCMHYKLLQHNFETVVQEETPNIIINEKTNNKDINYEKLKLNIKQHTKLIEFQGDMEAVYSDVMFFNFFGSSIVICLAGFQITTITGYNLIKFSLFLLCLLSELFMLCWYGEQLVENTQSVGTSAYNSAFYRTSLNFRKLIVYIIHRSQRPCELTALKFWVVSMQSFSKILSASWSYFTLLKTVYKELPNVKSHNHGL